MSHPTQPHFIPGQFRQAVQEFRLMCAETFDLICQGATRPVQIVWLVALGLLLVAVLPIHTEPTLKASLLEPKAPEQLGSD